MRRAADLQIGCAGNGATHQDTNIPDLATKIRMVSEAGVFDYIDRMPLDEEFRDALKASERHDLPLLTGTGNYTLGRDEPVFERNIIKARLLGSRVHNIQLLARHADGHLLSNDEVAAFYLWAYDFAMRHDVAPCLEVHINMWSEHYGRVEQVAALVQARGVPFAMTLDHSHVIFKIDNPHEQQVQDLAADLQAGTLQIDPAQPGNVMSRWIRGNFVLNAHARGAVPGNPVNTLARHPDGSFGRGVQYPFMQPGPGEYVTDDWDPDRLEPWRAVVRELLAHHATDADSPIRHIAAEYIPGIDYGAGHRYSIFEHNIACANWIRDEWAQALAKASSH